MVALAEGVELPKDQPAEIAASIHPVAADDAATLEAVKAASPHVRLIHQRMQDQIRAMYSPEDEMYFARIGTGAALGMYTMSEKEKQAITVYSEHVEAVRQWGRSERAKLGL